MLCARSYVFYEESATSAISAVSLHDALPILTIPAGTATGSYYIVAYADGRGVVAESQEGNNQRAVAIELKRTRLNSIESKICSAVSATKSTKMLATDTSAILVTVVSSVTTKT